MSPRDIYRLTNPILDDELDDIRASIPPVFDDPTRLTVVESEELKGVLYELASRQSESLKIFQPMIEQERFFASDSSERIALGGNRGGKTTATVIEIARAVTGQDPHDKYPKTDGRCILVGKDLTHCSKVFYQKLFKAGAFKIIKDELTEEWRTYNPNDPADKARAHEAKKAPALIPSRFYDFKKIAWENKKDEIPKTIPLKNGWTIHCFSSLGAPPQGWNVDMVAFDEEIEHPLWYPEMSARLLDNRVEDPVTGKVRSGKFLWSATPQAGTQQLYDLKVRGDELIGDPSPAIQIFEFGMLDNQWVSDTAKAEFIAKFRDNEDEINVRVYGKFALLGTRVYSEFMPKGVHGMADMPIPEDWTSYAIIDPGRQVCAVLFIAVPPPHSEWAGRKIVYDELYIKKCNAKIFAETFVRRVNGRPIEYAIIDHRAGRITEIGSGLTHEEQYSRALKEANFKFEKGGTTFVWSSDDVKAGIESVRNALHIIDGRSELVVIPDKTKHLLWEIERYSYRKLPSGVVTDEPIKLNDHACFVAGTQVLTKRGQLAIELVRVGDMAWTRGGWRKVVDAACTARNAKVMRVEFSDGRSLTGTSNHPIFVDGVGYISLGELRQGDVLVNPSGDIQCRDQSQRKVSRSSITGSLSGDTRIRREGAIVSISSRQLDCRHKGSVACIRRYGKTRTARFLKDSTSTTLTRIRSIIRSRILSASLNPSIYQITTGTYPLNDPIIVSFSLSGFGHFPPTGTHPRKEPIGTVKTRSLCGRIGNFLSESAITAASHIRLAIARLRGSARTNASRPLAELPASITSLDLAGFAESHSQSTDIQRSDTVPCHVVSVHTEAGRHPVYNLTVSDRHEYFANGILVSNCDCLRYACMAKLRYVRPRKRKEKPGYTTVCLERKKQRAKEKAKEESGWGGSYKVG